MAALTGQSGWQISDIGGTSMMAYLGPDVAAGLGTPTNVQKSLGPLMQSLHGSRSPKKWIAGHLLNADLGGSGTDSRNLTPLTTSANRAHSTFEQHIKNMLNECRQIEVDFSSTQQTRSVAAAAAQYPFYYGVRYTVTVSSDRYADRPDPADFHSYVASHIEIDYCFYKFKRDPYFPMMSSGPVRGADITANPKLVRLRSTAAPSPAHSPNITILPSNNPGLHFRARIDNEA
ncbi:hypothetical protein [Paracoccus aminophilus]|uniref:Uncharacterized protein n=1 Tax=Paracoccus aminophilus JCM 7686 TaxID=1367847 RepID=S5YQR0_PARAH|nr:hypothetical protein [Paracoccus aminophilus]AGT07571.1 hypothetical protein JCM7686_0462 [Paracoccus aminophilus JCM 7686]